MELFLIYLWTRLDAIGGLAITMRLIGIMIFAIICLVAVIASDYPQDFKKNMANMKPLQTLCVWAIILGLAVSTFLPSKKDAAIIFAGWSVLKVVQSETAGELGSKSLAVLNKALDSYLQNEKPKEPPK